jgi:hypothetical protein
MLNTAQKQVPRVNSVKITAIEFFEFEWNGLTEKGKYETAPCRIGLLIIAGADRAGWGECVILSEAKTFDPVQWTTGLNLKGLTVEEAIQFANEKKAAWGDDKSGMVLSALSDLAGQPQSGSSSLNVLHDLNPIDEEEELIARSQAYFAFL